MSTYRVTVIGEVREVYVIDAADENEARAVFDRGDAPEPELSEVENVEVQSIALCEEADTARSGNAGQ